MSNAPTPSETAVALFTPNESALRELVANSAPILSATDATVTQLHEARMPLVRARTTIENARVEIKAPYLAACQAIDAEAKRLTAITLPTEKAIETRQRALEAEAEKRKQEAAAAALRRASAWVQRFADVGARLDIVEAQGLQDATLEARLADETAAHTARVQAEAEARAKREAEEAEARAKRAAEEAAARAAAEVQLAAERERARVESERLAAESRALAEERARVEAERRQLAAERAAAEAHERERAAAEQQARAKAEREARIAAALPLAQRIEAYADALAGVAQPVHPAVQTTIHQALGSLRALAHRLASGEEVVR